MNSRFRISLLSLAALASGCANLGSADLSQLSDHNIGGATISLPAAWKLASYPMPMPGAVNYRIALGDTRVAITGIPNMDKRVFTEAKIAEMDGAEQYAPASNEGKASDTSLSDANRVGIYSAFTAKPGSGGFRVFPGEPYQAVTSATVVSHDMVYIISVASRSPDGADYRAATAALKTIR